MRNTKAGHDIKGVGVALVTPFADNGDVDFNALGALVDYVIANGTDYLVALGTTGETPTLNAEEKKDIIACVKERAAGRVPVVVGAGGYSTAEVVNLIRNTDFNGVSALLSVTPYYNKPSQEGLFRHYETVAGESPVPVILYNVPGRTGVNMSAETTLRIANNVGNVLGIKEACGSMTQMSRILSGRPEGFKVISGDDCLAIPLAAIGGDGVISVAANAFPKDFTEMIAAAYAGDIKTSSACYLRLFETMEALFEEGNPVGVKAAMHLKGMIRNVLRLPLVPASDRLLAKLEGLISANDL